MVRMTITNATVVVATKVPAKKIIEQWLDGCNIKAHNFINFRQASKVRSKYSLKIARCML